MIPDIFKYTNYKDFLRDYYRAKKAERKSFSYQYLAKKAGFKSKASFANIICGGLSLARKSITKVAFAIGLGKKESDYFYSLVHFNEAKTMEERSFHFDRMHQLSRTSPTTLDRNSQYEYYATWYHCVIRELAPVTDFMDDYGMLGSLVEPPLSASLAKKSVDLLVRLGLLKKMESGRYLQTDRMLSTGDEITSLALQKYHQEHLKIASASISNHAITMRDASSVTAGVSEKTFLQIKQEVRKFRKRLLSIAESEASPDAVYQIAFQLYPLSKIPKTWRRNNA